MQNIMCDMKKLTEYIMSAAGAAAIIAAAVFTPSCQSEYKVYDDAEYIMFADTMAIYPVQVDNQYFKVPVVSTIACDYDRTFGVEIINKGSNALERRHFRLRSNTLTIKAGQTRTDVEVQGLYENIEETDSLGFILSLVIPEEVKMPLYPTTTKVLMQKVCPYDTKNFEGYCVVTSLFLYYYSPTGTYQRLVKTSAHPTEPNTVILHNFLFDGYDINIKFDPSDPMNQYITLEDDQILSDEGSVFGISYGDDKIRCAGSPNYPSYFNSCGRYAEIWLRVYVEDIGNPIGDVGQYYNVVEWVSDQEADRLRRENGM